jgi:hypothetical protein
MNSLFTIAAGGVLIGFALLFMPPHTVLAE